MSGLVDEVARLLPNRVLGCQFASRKMLRLVIASTPAQISGLRRRGGR